MLDYKNSSPPLQLDANKKDYRPSVFQIIEIKNTISTT